MALYRKLTPVICAERYTPADTAALETLVGADNFIAATASYLGLAALHFLNARGIRERRGK